MVAILCARAPGCRFWPGALLLAALVQFVGCANKTEAAPPPPPEVQVVNIEQKDVPVYGEWVATLDGFVNADIRPQVPGYLMKQTYKKAPGCVKVTCCLKSIRAPLKLHCSGPGTAGTG